MTRSTAYKVTIAFLVAILITASFSTDSVPNIMSKPQRAHAQFAPTPVETVPPPVETVPPSIPVSGYEVFDNPSYSTGWLGGSPNGQDGYGPGRYYGNSNYAYTTSAGSWARWYLPHPLTGTYEIQAYIPYHPYAAATTQYYIAECVSSGCVNHVTPAINQYDHVGWVSLGNYTFRGNQTRVYIWLDYDSGVTPYNGLSSVAMDAMRIRRVDRETTTTMPPETSTPGLPRNVSWNVATVSGERMIVASWSPPADNGGAAITGYRVTISRPGATFGPYNNSPSDLDISFKNPRSSTTYEVRVAAKNIHGTGRESSALITLPDHGLATSPGRPTNAYMRLVGGSKDDAMNIVEISWDPPVNDGGANITEYIIRISRPRLSDKIGPWSKTYHRTSRKFKFTGRSDVDATYTIKVAAKNRIGTGESVAGTIMTLVCNIPWWDPFTECAFAPGGGRLE